MKRLSLRQDGPRVSSFETAGGDVCDTGFDMCYSVGGTRGAAPFRREGASGFGPLRAWSPARPGGPPSGVPRSPMQ